MITGFNTDIERDGVVYHVQTEDKGLDSPLILSLVYSGGEILAAKRTPYQDLIAEGFTDEALAARLKRQHRLICAAINAGRIEELKQMGARRETVARAKSAPPAKIEQAPVEPSAAPQAEVHDEFEIETSSAKHEELVRAPSAESVMTVRPVEPQVPAPPPLEVFEEFVIETSAARPLATDWKPKVEELAAETPAPEPQLPSLPKSFDTHLPPLTPPKEKTVSAQRESAYTVYDSRRPSRSKKSAKRDQELVLTILDDEEFHAGESVTIRVLLQRHIANSEKPLGGVAVSVKVLGASFRPQIYSVKTQRDGVAIVSVDLPQFSSGRAAVVVRAEAHEQSVELRRVIHPAG